MMLNLLMAILNNILIYMTFFLMYLLNWNFKFSLMMITMTFLIMKIVKGSLKTFNFYNNNMKNMFMMILMYFLILLFFSSEIINFYVVFEFSSLLIFLSLIITSKNMERIKASLYLFFFMGIGTFPFIVMVYFINKELSMIFFMFSFCLKLPIFFFHLWLPKAHVEANYYDSMVLAGLLLKMGGYGLMSMNINFSLILYLNLWCTNFMFILSLIVLLNSDLKMILAYFSIIHMMGMILFLYSNSMMMENMILLNLINHAFLASLMFFIMGLMYENSKSRSILMNKSLYLNNNYLFIFFLFTLFLNMGFPPFMSFYSEMCMYFSMFNYSSYLICIMLGLMMFVTLTNMNLINMICNFINIKYFSYIKLSILYKSLILEHLILILLMI